MQYHIYVVDYCTALRVIKLQPRFKVCNISCLRVLKSVLFHSSELLLTGIQTIKRSKKKTAFMLQQIVTALKLHNFRLIKRLVQYQSETSICDVDLKVKFNLGLFLVFFVLNFFDVTVCVYGTCTGTHIF